MNEWTKIVTNPLGLAGFALFVVLLLVRSKVTRTDKSLFGRALIVMAIIALVGGIGLAYLQRSTPAAKPQLQEPSPNVIHQSTKGSRSPAVANVDGDVTITESSKTETNK